MALKNLLETRLTNQYFRPPPLKINVIEIMDSPKVISWDFSHTNVRPAVTKRNKVAVVTDGVTCEKVTIYEQFAKKIKSGCSYIMRGHTLRGGAPPYYLNITGSTMFFRTSDMEVAEGLRKEAEALLHPQSPVTHLSECCSKQGLMTVEGQVVEASPVIKLVSGKDFIPLQKLTLQQGSDRMEVCLWREAAVDPVHLGDRVIITHLKARNNSSLHSTLHTTFQKPEKVSREAEILGVMGDSQEEVLQVLLRDDTIYEIRREVWDPVSHLNKKGSIKAIITMEGGVIVKLDVVQEEE